MTESEINTAATYERISDDQAGDGHGVANQGKANEEYCARRGLVITARYADNDISATSGKRRPEYEEMMAAAARREFGAIVVFHTSRLWRNRVERAQAIEVLREAGVSVLAARGPSLDMSTAYGRGMAALLGEFDTMETEVKAERQKLAYEAKARAGKRPQASHRAFGYQPGGLKADEAEAAAIRWAADCLLGGGTVSAVRREWARRGLVTAQTGRPFTRQSILTILRNPRNAGLACLPRDKARGEAFGAVIGKGQWEPVLDEDTWRALDALLASTDRTVTFERDGQVVTRKMRVGAQQGVRSLLGGLAVCRCGNTVTSAPNHLGYRVYRCNTATRGGRPGPHVSVRAEAADEYVEAVMVRFLRDKKAVRRKAPAPGAREAALRKEEDRITRRLEAAGGDWMLGDGEDGELALPAVIRGAVARGQARLAEISAELAGLRKHSVLDRFLGTGDVQATWKSADLTVKRAVIRAVTAVELSPAGRGARSYDPAQKIAMPGIPGRARG